jgi:hypothetical protein
VACVAISDGHIFHAVDLGHGVPRDRLFCDLSQEGPPGDLWWIGPDGITEPRAVTETCRFRILARAPDRPSAELEAGVEEVRLHPRYQVPATCFAYVGSVDDPSTWHLPYLLADGTVDSARLPKAIGAVLKNYRGVRVKTIPEKAIPDVLIQLGRAADSTGKISRQGPPASPTYAELLEALTQLERLDEPFLL